MKAQQLADLLNGREIDREITTEECQQAKAGNLLVVFGASDDLTELRGVIYDEVGASNGTNIKIAKALRALRDWDDVDHYDEDECRQYFEDKALPYITINVEWDRPPFSWFITAEIEESACAEFIIMDGNEQYCRGLVIDLTEAFKNL